MHTDHKLRYNWGTHFLNVALYILFISTIFIYHSRSGESTMTEEVSLWITLNWIVLYFEAFTSWGKTAWFICLDFGWILSSMFSSESYPPSSSRWPSEQQTPVRPEGTSPLRYVYLEVTLFVQLTFLDISEVTAFNYLLLSHMWISEMSKKTQTGSILRYTYFMSILASILCQLSFLVIWSSGSFSDY
jgi:hypothetical protein